MVNDSNQILNRKFGTLNQREFAHHIDIINQGLNFINAAFFPTTLTLDSGIISTYSPYSAAQIQAAIVDQKTNITNWFVREHCLANFYKEKPDIVGISLLRMNQFIPGFTLASILRNTMNVHIVFGGAAMSQLAEFFFRLPKLHYLLDSIIYGPAEQSLDTLIKHLSNGETLKDVPNLIYKQDNKLITSKRQADFALDQAILPEYNEPRPRPIIAIENSRNCYWGQCSFCNFGMIYGKKHNSLTYEERKFSLVAKELKAMKTIYNPLFIRFTDSVVSPQRLAKITHYIKTHGLALRSLAYIRAEPEFTSLKFCNDLAMGGFKIAVFGLESGSSKINAKHRKGVDLENVETILSNFKECGIISMLFIIVGFPDEDESDLEKTLEFLDRNKKHIELSFVTPFLLNFNSQIFDEPNYFGINKIYPQRGQDINRTYRYKHQRKRTKRFNLLSKQLITKYTSPRNSLILGCLDKE